MRKHLVIPDTQVKPGVDITHLRWISQYIVEKKPDVIVHLGDHWDMESLSSYDHGKKQMEGRRYRADVYAGNYALTVLTGAIDDYNEQRRRWKEKLYLPEKYLLRGNHEERITRAIDADAKLDGAIGLHDLESPGWEVSDYLEELKIDGISYSHFFYNHMSGRALGGHAITRLKNIGYSFTMGHQQVFDYACRPVGNKMQHALVCGACYLHDESYKGPQANRHFRGLIVKHQVCEGDYDIMKVSLDFLCREYEGVSLDEWWANAGHNEGAIYAPTFEEWLDTQAGSS